MFQVTDLILVTLQEVFHSSYDWLEYAEILSTAGGCCTAALSILIFSASCISVYQNSQSTTPQLVFIILLYPSLILWGIFLAISIGSTFVSTVLDQHCFNKDIEPIWTHWIDGHSICDTILEGKNHCPRLCRSFPRAYLRFLASNCDSR